MYLVVYDICDSKRLRHISKMLEAIGVRVQNSTFELDNSIIDININSLYNKLKDICEDEDKFFIYKTKDKKDIQVSTKNWDMVF